MADVEVVAVEEAVIAVVEVEGEDKLTTNQKLLNP